MDRYPKRLIEVDLPIKKISVHARREKGIRHGHVSTLHIWWARRPLAACRALICAALWPDPADSLCPETFRKEARKLMNQWVKHHLKLVSQDSWSTFVAIQKTPEKLNDNVELRKVLLNFIADFAAWKNSTIKEYLDTSRMLTKVAHRALNGNPESRPLVVDPFAGGGSIPLEASRVGAEAYASDLNPVAVLLNKVVLEYIPKYGEILVDEVNKWGDWIKNETEILLRQYYPIDSDGSVPIAYLWARTIKCEGPGCGMTIPLLTNFWLSKKTNRKLGLLPTVNHSKKEIQFKIVKDPDYTKMQKGIVKRGSVTCPSCGFTTPANNVKTQFIPRAGGANDAMLVAVATISNKTKGRQYRLPTKDDYDAVAKARNYIISHERDLRNYIPDESLPYLRSIFNINLLGVDKWHQLYTYRQLLALITLVMKLNDVKSKMSASKLDRGLIEAVLTLLALNINRLADLSNSLCGWEPVAECPRHLFGRQAMPIIWDFAEGVPIGSSSGSWQILIDRTGHTLTELGHDWIEASVAQSSAAKQSLPDDVADVFITDPPYYDLVPYADLSDFFYVWLKRSLGNEFKELFKDNLTPKKEEIVQLAERNEIYSYKTKNNYEQLMRKAMSESLRILKPEGIGVVFFAHKGTEAWETQLQAMIDAGWIITASWPIDTECESRMRAMNSAVLASSIQLICRPRKDENTSDANIGDWREILSELPNRIKEWMHRLAEENVGGADAIFACIGPALEIYSKYSRVERTNGEQVTLREYLEQIWAVVAKQALNMIFKGADVTGFEEDSRLTAMWLWTISTGNDDDKCGVSDEQYGSNDEYEDEEKSIKAKKTGGYYLEYDAARKIAQGLGAHLEKLQYLVEIKGDSARLLPVAERANYLFKKQIDQKTQITKKKKERQLNLFESQEISDQDDGHWKLEQTDGIGKTVLDQLHQSMLLFASGRSDALKRFLIEDGVGKDQRFWRLAQALSALYPIKSEEKRWVDGVIARKKSLGL